SRHVIFTKFDSDTLLHPKFFSALTYRYLTTENRLKRFFGPAILIYSNNQWNVPAITRVFFGTLTLGVLNEWVAERTKKQSFSCYCGSFHEFEKADFWDPSTGAEDTYYYWKMFLHHDGDFSGEPFFLPVTMDAVEGTSLMGALKALYKQQLRWGWGALIMPLALQGMSWNPRISFMKKISKFTLLFRVYNFLLTAGILLTITAPILTALSHDIGYSSISVNLPRVISVILTAGLVFQLPTKYYIWKFYGAPPKSRSVFFRIWWWCFEPLLMFVNIWTYYLIPRIQALYELTLGKNRKKFIVSIEGRLPEKAG
ncbi:MAG: hypothetical protein PHG63_02605, partial [Candidatus Dojkabacteria bacterium]|nr:hypothetical protein [Candidatus Dojkabacteria bacterium]